MRVNVYAEETTDRVEVVYKSNREGEWIGLRFYLELPISYPIAGGHQVTQRGPTLQAPGGTDRSSAVTFWGKNEGELEKLMEKGLYAIRRLRSGAQMGYQGQSQTSQVAGQIVGGGANKIPSNDINRDQYGR